MAGRTPMFAVMGVARRVAGLFGRRFTPRPVVDAMIRMSEGGDRFGLRRGGLTFRRLAQQHPHGVVVAPHIRTGVLGEVVVYRGGRVRLEHDDIAAEIGALSRRSRPEDFPMRLIGMREPRSENSWMHNSPLLMRGKRIHRALMHLDDAAGTADRRRRRGCGPLPVRADRASGVADRRHRARHHRRSAWLGHKGTGGWRLANSAGGANVNQLMSSDPRTSRRWPGCPG